MLTSHTPLHVPSTLLHMLTHKLNHTSSLIQCPSPTQAPLYKLPHTSSLIQTPSCKLPHANSLIQTPSYKRTHKLPHTRSLVHAPSYTLPPNILGKISSLLTSSQTMKGNTNIYGIQSMVICYSRLIPLIAWCYLVLCQGLQRCINTENTEFALLSRYIGMVDSLNWGFSIGLLVLYWDSLPLIKVCTR